MSGHRLLHAVPIATAAFLTFAIQPLVARGLLPWFGGGAGVWAACLFFFQLALLAGYAYAYISTRWLSLRGQALLHLALLVLAACTLPISGSREAGGGEPVLAILWQATRSVGLPCVLLFATSPLLGHWLGQTRPGSPYRFYALSNAGSLLGLLSYPFVIEPLFGLDRQRLAWSLLFVAFALSCALAAIALLRHRAPPVAAATASEGPRPQRLLWVTLSGFGVMLLQGITHELTQNISPVPFLWVLPLAIYLVTLILAFAGPRFAMRRLALGLFAFSVVPTLWLSFIWSVISLPLMVTLCSLTLFSGCLVCHGELARLAPGRERLAGYYLWVALGGVLGSVVMTLVAPRVFDRLWELHLALVGTLFLGGLCRTRDPLAGRRRPASLMPGLLTWGVLAAGLLALSLLPSRARRPELAVIRNFYGRVSVLESQKDGVPLREMFNGRIVHGSQRMSPAGRREPRLYYARGTGVAAALEHAHRKVGIIGEGAATIAIYAQAGDEQRYYELNPAVHALAERYFTYLADSAGRISVVIGDGRLMLARDGAVGFDVLVLDAFSSDAIPVHLLTREAFAIYARALRPGGVLAINITNKYLELGPVVRALAAERHWPVVRTRTVFSDDSGEVTWLLLSTDAAFLASPAVKALESPWPRPDVGPAWTDDHASLLGVLK